VLEMLKEWILFFIKDDELRKTILRQHQTRAVVKVMARCADENKKTGLVWHTQGSGKTFTMITAARLILERQDVFGKATVILIIDRNELEGQLIGWVDRLLGELQTRDIKQHRTVNQGPTGDKNNVEPEYQQLMQLLSDTDEHMAQAPASRRSTER